MVLPLLGLVDKPKSKSNFSLLFQNTALQIRVLYQKPCPKNPRAIDRLAVEFTMKRPVNPSSKGEKNDGLVSIDQKKVKMKMKKNVMRMGGGGLSLEAFAKAKTKSNDYNPALIKKQREFYKNAKCVSKYKKSLRQQGQQTGNYPQIRSREDENETKKAGEMSQSYKKNKRSSAQSLREVYEQKREEEEKANMEREAIVRAKKEERERTESRRKAVREKMLKKTRSGQPVMKYRIEHLLETLQGSTR